MIEDIADEMQRLKGAPPPAILKVFPPAEIFRVKLTIAILLICLGLLARPIEAQAPLPAGWPNRVELGMMDSPGGAAAMRTTAPFAFRYQYLAGGANTGNGWATWNTNGDFARFYIENSVANGVIPVFTYYMMLSLVARRRSPSRKRSSTNLNNTATMTAYYNDLKLFFQKAGAFPTQKVVLHVEPDLWGYMEQRSTNDNAATVPAKVSETGVPETGGPAEQPVRVCPRHHQTSRRVRPERECRLPHQRVGHRHRHRAVESPGRDGGRARGRGRQLLQLAGRRTSTSHSRNSAIAIRASISTCTAMAATPGGTRRISGAACAFSADSPPSRGRES